VDVPGTVELIGVAMGLGGPDIGAASGPIALRRGGLANATGGHWTPTLLPRVGGQRSRLDAATELNARLAARVAATLARNRFPLVIGGDHSIAAGTWAGAAVHVQPRGALGLIWIDAHMDAHTPATTPSGNPHGMPLARLLGASGVSAAFAPEHVALIGVRSFEPDEAALLGRLGVRVYDADEVAKRGLAIVMDEAREQVTRGTAGFGVTLDLDAIDPRDAPGTGTREPGGLIGAEVIAACAKLGADSRLVAAEIVEFDPAHDIDDRTLTLAIELARGLTLATRAEALEPVAEHRAPLARSR
jgi:arginase